MCHYDLIRKFSLFEHFDGELVVDSRLVAVRLGIQHESFMRTVDKYQARIETKFGHLRFEIGTVRNSVGAVNEVKYVLLTEAQATTLMTLSRNTDEVVDCKFDLVEAFEKAKTELRLRRFTSATHKVYLLDDPVKWSDRGRVFKENFYSEIYLLNNWVYQPGKTSHPVRVAQITVDVVYERLQPGVWKELVKKNPKVNGRRKHCCHQFLTENIGNQHLRQHLYAVTKLMAGSSSWREFMYLLNRIHPKTSEVQMDILFELFSNSSSDYEIWRRLVS